MPNKRRDPLIVDSVVLDDDTPKYTFVNADGTVASANGDAFGITMESGEGGRLPVPVARLGFVPVRIGTASGITAEKQDIVVGSNGVGEAVPGSGGGTAYVVARSEEAASEDGAQIGAWIDCVSANRSVDIPT